MDSLAPADADALLRAVLKTPTDTVARLVLADWLEETGTKPNIAWATYLRLRVEATTADAISRELAFDKIRDVEPLIQAKVTLKAVDIHEKLFDLVDVLPAPCFHLKLKDFTPPAIIFRGIRESMLREKRSVPLAYREGTFCFATASANLAETREELSTDLLSKVFLMQTKLADVEAVLNAHYHRPRSVVPSATVEVTNAPVVHNPDAALEADTPWEGILRVIDEARKEKAGGVEIMATNADLYAIRYVVHGSPQRRYTSQAAWGRELVAATERLKREPIPGVKVKDRNTFFGPGVRLVFAF